MQAYKYDPLDRITEAKETVNGTQTWIQNWGYDRYGNRSSFTQNLYGYTSVSSPSIDTATNRFKSGQSYTFDKNGNVTVDEAGHQFTYNGDNKPTQVTLSLEKGGTTTLGTYYYDGEGKRVKKTTYTSDNVIFVYSNGKLVEERNASTNALQTSYIYAGSQLLATETATATNYTATDQLGSPRVITDQTGAVVARRDFMPFGEELYVDGTYRKTSDKYSTSGQDAVRQRFTGYQKDAETGLDFAEARYYQNQHGRFTAVDPLLASGKSANPQTFNRYVYTMNRPLVLADHSGLQAGGTWYTPTVPDGNTSPVFVNKGAAPPNNFSEVTARNQAGQLISPTANPNIDIALNPSGPYRGPIVYPSWQTGGSPEVYGMSVNTEAMSDWDKKGWDYAHSDSYNHWFAQTGAVETAIQPHDIALFAVPFRFGVVGKSLSEGAAAGTDVTVGRWMGQGEFSAMKNTSMVQESFSGTTKVAFPSNPNTFMRQAESGSLYVEFGVPRTSVMPTGAGTARIAGPNSIDGLNALRFGRPVPQMPPASNLFCIMCKK